MTTIKDIIKTWLKDNGYDGLYDDECGCEIDDLFPCGEPNEHCEAGYKIKFNHPEHGPGEYLSSEWDVAVGKLIMAFCREAKP